LLSLTKGPDPRFGMQAPLYSSASLHTPSGLTASLTGTRSVTLSDPNNPLSLSSLTDTVTINGNSFTGTYNGTARTVTDHTPAGRQVITTLDSLGRIISYQPPSLTAMQYAYDARGRLSQLT